MIASRQRPAFPLVSGDACETALHVGDAFGMGEQEGTILDDGIDDHASDFVSRELVGTQGR